MTYKNQTEYIPALRYGWLTPFFDLFIRLTTRELTFKRLLVEEARIEKGHRVLDLGCGTATLTILIKKLYPEAQVIGLDGDPKVLKIAQAKIAKTGLEIKLEQGMAFELPYPDSSFDRVLSSLLFHHLIRENKIRTVKEVYRVLRPGGKLIIGDFGRPNNAAMYLISLVMRRLEETEDLIKGLLPDMLRRAGFDAVDDFTRYMMIFGTTSLYRALKPPHEHKGT